ncbi:MAG: glycoside hydrolase family 88 protein [Paludibacteraceae bacterium]|nr:glycoside hydrolase family 88 protein [Paludibacteraceae bacterium]
MKTTHIIVMAAAGILLAACAKPQPVRYSEQMINARMSAWYNKDNCVGFPNANSTNGVTVPEIAATWDYVPGVVAKGILDVWQYYQDSAWADAWYIGLAQWADSLDQAELDRLVRGGILDDLNCAKVFLGLYEGAKPGGRFENPEKAAYYMEQMHRAAEGLAEHKAKYSLPNGGWMHKATDNPEKSYWGQMWCDGAYMGPALLAQLLAVGACEGTGLGWNDVYTQFEVSWPYLWDEEKQLLYHVLFTDVTTNKNARAIYEAGHAYKSQFSILNYHRFITPRSLGDAPLDGISSRWWMYWKRI